MKFLPSTSNSELHVAQAGTKHEKNPGIFFCIQQQNKHVRNSFNKNHQKQFLIYGQPVCQSLCYCHNPHPGSILGLG